MTKSHTHESEYSNPQVRLEWEAPIRPHKKPSGKIMRFYLALALLLSLFVLFFSDTIILVPIWAILFLFYTLTTTPPQTIKHRITKFGVESADVTVRWDMISYFYFTERFGFTILTIVGHPPYHPHMFFVVPDVALKSKLIHLLSDHIVYREDYKKSFTERAVDWLAQLVPEDE